MTTTGTVVLKNDNINALHIICLFRVHMLSILSTLSSFQCK